MLVNGHSFSTRVATGIAKEATNQLFAIIRVLTDIAHACAWISLKNGYMMIITHGFSVTEGLG